MGAMTGDTELQNTADTIAAQSQLVTDGVDRAEATPNQANETGVSVADVNTLKANLASEISRLQNMVPPVPVPQNALALMAIDPSMVTNTAQLKGLYDLFAGAVRETGAVEVQADVGEVAETAMEVGTAAMASPMLAKGARAIASGMKSEPWMQNVMDTTTLAKFQQSFVNDTQFAKATDKFGQVLMAGASLSSDPEEQQIQLGTPAPGRETFEYQTPGAAVMNIGLGQARGVEQGAGMARTVPK